MAAATLREKRFTGGIVVVDPVKEGPVDRTQLTKDALAGKVPLDLIAFESFSTVKCDRVQASLKAFSAARNSPMSSDIQRM